MGLLAVGLVAVVSDAHGQTPEIALETLLTGLAQPTSITHAGDSRLFLTLQRGRVVIVEDGRLLPTAFLDIQPLVSCCGERGLLGLAFHPRYAENGFFFVDYTNTAGDTVIARYRATPSNPNAADPASGVTLMTIDQPFANHNGGQLAFGPDGYLYIGMGDGGSANDPMCNGQRDDALLGKILRIDVDANAESPFYGIPPDNPFADPGGARDEIWAKGLRNPWRFSFDRETGDLYIGDVGQGAREEIDFQPVGSRGGENYGWKMMEGTLCGGGGTSGCPPGTATCNAPGLTRPVIEYPHSGGDCSVTGGYVYRGRSFPQLVGSYVYGDYCTGKIWGASRNSSGTWTTRLFPPRAANLTTFGEDAAGEVYVGTESGLLARIVNEPGSPGSRLRRAGLGHFPGRRVRRRDGRRLRPRRHGLVRGSGCAVGRHSRFERNAAARRDAAARSRSGRRRRVEPGRPERDAPRRLHIRGALSRRVSAAKSAHGHSTLRTTSAPATNPERYARCGKWRPDPECGKWRPDPV